MSRTLHRALPLVAAAVLLAGCGGGEVVVADAPEPKPAAAEPSPGPPRVLGGSVTVGPATTDPDAAPRRTYADAPECTRRPGLSPDLEPDELGTKALQDATQEIAIKYESKERGETGKYYVGIVLCEAGNFFSLFRVPGGAAFDASIRAIARRNHVKVHLLDTKYSLAALERARAVVKARQDALAAAGSRLVSTHSEYQDGAFMSVGVAGDAAPAEHVLADLGDRIRVYGETMAREPL